MENCRQEATHPITFEVAEVLTDQGQRRFQTRARLDTMVIANLGTSQQTELEAFDVITQALAAGLRNERDVRSSCQQLNGKLEDGL